MQALRLEQIWSKQQILGAYLDRMDYGNFRIGIASAANYYFGKPPNDLSLAECAFLASLPQAPSRLNPLRHLDRALQRQRQVLERWSALAWSRHRRTNVRGRSRFASRCDRRISMRPILSISLGKSARFAPAAKSAPRSILP
jgi:penicillin-binding protein 1C